MEGRTHVSAHVPRPCRGGPMCPPRNIPRGRVLGRTHRCAPTGFCPFRGQWPLSGMCVSSPIMPKPRRGGPMFPPMSPGLLGRTHVSALEPKHVGADPCVRPQTLDRKCMPEKTSNGLFQPWLEPWLPAWLPEQGLQERPWREREPELVSWREAEHLPWA